MTVDLIGWMEQMFQSTWFYALVLLAAVSCVWYYMSHIRSGSTTAKNIIMGQPMMLLIILSAVIALVVFVTQVWDIQLM